MSLFDGALSAAMNPGALLGDPSSLLASFARAFDQSTRLLQLSFASGAGIPDNTLLPHQLTGFEEVNGDLRYELTALSSDADLELKTMLGVPVQIDLLTDSGESRSIVGLVTSLRQEGSDGGFAQYRLVIESALAPLALRRTWRIFLNLSVLDLVQQLVQEHLDANTVLAASLDLDVRCLGQYPQREFLFQCGESDADFLRRLLAREGISFVVSPASDSSTDLPKMTLTLFDDPRDLDPNEAGTVRFHRADGTEASDTITQWNGLRSLQVSSVARNAWDAGSASVSRSSEASCGQQGDYGADLASTLEDYRYHPGLQEDPLRFDTLAARRMKAREGWAKRFQGVGSVRAFRAGTWFTLQDHPIHDGDDPQDRDFVLTRVELQAENNLPRDLAEGPLARFAPPGDGPHPPFKCAFTCVRRGIPILADETAPPNPGPLTATVVGPAGEEVHTDAAGRVKVRFPFARAAEHLQAGATGTDRDSAWIRLAQPWGSASYGGSFVPRAGDEVLVRFLGNDPDQPLIMGSVPNGQRRPASFSGASCLPGDRAISGFRSEMLKGTGGNELMFDDSTGELRARLASDHAQSELNLGHIVHPRSNGSAAPKGDGFELRSAAYGAVRGEQGLLITTEAGRASLEAQGLITQVQNGRDLSQALSDLSEKHQAAKLGTLDAGKQLQDNLEHTAPAQGSQIPAFGAAVLALSSPGTIVRGTPRDQVFSAGAGIHMDSGGDTALAVGKRLVMAVKEAWSVFAAKSGIKLFAGQGDIAIQAHQGPIGIAADQAVKVVSLNASLSLLAKTGLRLCAGGAEVLLKGGNLTITCPGSVEIKGGLSILSGAQIPTNLPALPKVAPKESTAFSQCFDLNEPLSGFSELIQDNAALEFEIRDQQGMTYGHGNLNDQLTTRRVFTNEAKDLGLFLSGGPWMATMEEIHIPTLPSASNTPSPSDKGTNP